MLKYRVMFCDELIDMTSRRSVVAPNLISHRYEANQTYRDMPYRRKSNRIVFKRKVLNLLQTFNGLHHYHHSCILLIV